MKISADVLNAAQVQLSLNKHSTEKRRVVRPNISIVDLAALKSCRDIETGKRIHAELIENGEDGNMFVATTLMGMYAKCGNMVEARKIFESMPHRDVVSWNTVILGYAENGEAEKALRLLSQVRLPNHITFVAAIKACAAWAGKIDREQMEERATCYSMGKAIYALVLESGYALNIYLETTIVDLYSKCGNMVDAHKVFDSMTHRDVVTWNAIIMGYADNGQGELAYQLFLSMQREGLTPNGVTYVAALKANISQKEVENVVKVKFLENGRSIHAQLAKSGYESNIYVANTLIDMYANCECLEEARRVFDKIQHRDVVSWNILISGYAEQHECELALQLFTIMQEMCRPNSVTYVAILKACGKLVADPVDVSTCLEMGRIIHKEAEKGGFVLNIYLATSLISMYAKCGAIVEAREVFNRVPNPNVVTWNAIISGYNMESSQSRVSLQLFQLMQEQGCVPDGATFIAVLKACGNLAVEQKKQAETDFLKTGREMHQLIRKSQYHQDVYVATSLLDMYMKFGSIVDARLVFDGMVQHDAVTWAAIVTGYAENGEGELSLHLYAIMQEQGCLPDAVTFIAALKSCVCSIYNEKGNTKLVKPACLRKVKVIHAQVNESVHSSNLYIATMIVDTYAKCGNMADAQWVFNCMKYNTTASWNAMIFGYAQNDDAELALQLFDDMRQHGGCIPNRVTYLAALKATSSLAALESGKRIEYEIQIEGLQSDPAIANCLLDFYGKCGSMVDAQQVFNSIDPKDLVTWNTLMAGYSWQGDSQRVFDIFKLMQIKCVNPDGITFLSLLTVCNHAGLVSEGKKYFEAMSLSYGLDPTIEHYTCVVDLLGRANHLHDALKMVQNMPFQPTLWILEALLSACWKWTNVSVGRLVFDSILRLNTTVDTAFVLMAKIYAGAGMWQENAIVIAMRENATRRNSSSLT